MFDTKVGRLRWNIVELIPVRIKGEPERVGQSSLGYASTLAEAKALATRNPKRHTIVVNSSGDVRFEHKPAN